MTTRDQVKRAVGIDRGESARGSTPDYGPNLPERLFTARERKGVDLYRAERDTKIRARYLAALERGDYKELPGAVYTKGFLRNYALYLGLDPDDVLLQWRRERGEIKETAPVIVVPRPITAPRKGLTFSPAIVVAAIMTVAVAAFAIYLGMQIQRYVEPPTIAVTQPPTAVVDVDETATSFVLRGTSIPGATVSIVSPSWDQPMLVTADTNGAWIADIDLRRGRNQFDISARDPTTQKTSDDTKRIFITVPFREIETPTLSVDQPADGATFENGAIPVQGATTNAKEVVVHATYTGPAEGDCPTEERADPGAGQGCRRRGRDVQRAVRVDDGPLVADGHCLQRRGQDDIAHAQRHGRLQGREPRLADQGRSRLDQGLGRRQGRQEGGCCRDGLQERQDPHVPGQEVDRGPDRLVRRDAVHAEWHEARRAREIGDPGDLALRASGRTAEDQSPLTAGDRRPVTDDRLVALAERLYTVCIDRGLTVATAESCTGGLVAHAITEIAGSSAYFLGGFVTYADDVKRDQLGIPAELLAAHGAVSAQVARAMAEGARSRLRTTIAVSITGIAGPGGGSDEKPVGLTYVAVADEAGADVRRHLWTGDRSANKRDSAVAALQLLLERLGS